MKNQLNNNNRLTNQEFCKNALDKRAVFLCKVLERGGEKIADSAVALNKNALSRQ
jgi:hypothetical protein